MTTFCSIQNEWVTGTPAINQFENQDFFLRELKNNSRRVLQICDLLNDKNIFEDMDLIIYTPHWAKIDSFFPEVQHFFESYHKITEVHLKFLLRVKFHRNTAANKF